SFSRGPIHYLQRDRKTNFKIERVSCWRNRPRGENLLALCPALEWQVGFGGVLLPRRGRVRSRGLGSIDCNSTEVPRDLLEKILVERLTQNHAQRFRLSREHGRCAQIECAVVAHDGAEIPSDKRRRVKASRGLWPRAVR